MRSPFKKRGLLLCWLLVFCSLPTACGMRVKNRAEEVAVILNAEGFTNVAHNVRISASRVTAKRDEGGFVIEIYRAKFGEVLEFMEQTLGTQSSKLGTNVNGFECTTFNRGTEGFGFLVTETPNGVEVIGIE